MPKLFGHSRAYFLTRFQWHQLVIPRLLRHQVCVRTNIERRYMEAFIWIQRAENIAARSSRRAQYNNVFHSLISFRES